MAKTVFICSHYTGKSGGLLNLENYLLSGNVSLYELLNPLDDYASINTKFITPKNFKEIKRKPRSILNLFEDFIISVFYIQKTKFDVFIGASNFDTIPAIFCKIILRKKIERIIYFPRDFAEDRFKNRFLNTIYLNIEYIANKYSDLIVSNTKRAELKRLQLGLSQNKSIIIPNPVHLVKPSFKEKVLNKSSFIYVGDVSQEHGLYELVELMTPLIKELTIIGVGKDLERVAELCKSKSFKFKIYRNKSRQFVMNYLDTFKGIGLAPYNNQSKWTYYCSPLKVGEYISSGIPALMSSVPEVAKTITKDNLGITYKELNLNEIKEKLNALNLDKFYIRSKKFYKTNNVDHAFKALELK